MTTPVEFRPWHTIPADHKRGEGDDREVLGATFQGEPVWLPWMGVDESPDLQAFRYGGVFYLDEITT